MRLNSLAAAVLIISFSAAGASHAASFDCEAQMLSRVVHPNVVSMCGLGHAAGNRPFLVMEYLEGRNLGALAEQGGGWVGLDLQAGGGGFDLRLEGFEGSGEEV